MTTEANNKKQKKGLLAAIWESMTKTGGCCGSGGNCCGPAAGNPAEEKTKGKEGGLSAGERHGS